MLGSRLCTSDAAEGSDAASVADSSGISGGIPLKLGANVGHRVLMLPNQKALGEIVEISLAFGSAKEYSTNFEDAS